MMTDDMEVRPERRLSNNPRVKILGVYVDVITLSETVNLVEKYIEEKQPLHLIGVNADKVNLATENPKIMEIVNNCGVINADGASMILAGKFLKKDLPERVAGIDLMEKLMERCSRDNHSVYFLGAGEKVVQETVEFYKTKYLNLRISGYRNGYFSDNEWDLIGNDLLEKNPDIVFVGITSPKKEYLVEYLQNLGVNSVMMGVGGSFDVISGKIKRAPKWMQNNNLEWLFRVVQEPKRLIKRYLIGNFKFALKVILEKSK